MDHRVVSGQPHASHTVCPALKPLQGGTAGEVRFKFLYLPAAEKSHGHTNKMNVYGDVVTDEMETAAGKVAGMAFGSDGALEERDAG